MRSMRNRLGLGEGSKNSSGSGPIQGVGSGHVDGEGSATRKTISSSGRCRRRRKVLRDIWCIARVFWFIASVRRFWRKRKLDRRWKPSDRGELSSGRRSEGQDSRLALWLGNGLREYRGRGCDTHIVKDGAVGDRDRRGLESLDMRRLAEDRNYRHVT